MKVAHSKDVSWHKVACEFTLIDGLNAVGGVAPITRAVFTASNEPFHQQTRGYTRLGEDGIGDFRLLGLLRASSCNWLFEKH